MNQLIRFGLVLGSICLAATLVLALTYEVTKPRIEEQLRKEERAALGKIMPSADSFEEKSIDGIEYFEAKKAGQVEGYCIKTAANGYNARIRMVVGIDPSGVIKGIEVLEQHETPGLGTKITQTRPGESEPWFLRQFKAKDAKTLAIRKNIDGSAKLTIDPDRGGRIDAITGATITSKAVTDAVNKTVTEFLEKMRGK